MIYVTLQGRAVDTEKELTSAQRHVLQKLLAWEHLGIEPEAFTARRAKAQAQGWGNQGPMEQTPAFTAVADDLVARLAARHGQRPGPDWLKPQAWPGRYAGGGLEAGRMEGGRLELLVRDAADLERGRIWLTMAPDQDPEQVLDRAAAELAGGGGLISELRDLGLRVSA